MPEATTLPLLLAVLSAAQYGISAHVVRKGLAYVDARVGVAISTGATACTFLLFAPHWMRADDWKNPGLLLFAALGLVHPVISRYMAYEANRRVGATISTVFESVSPLLSVILAVLVLAERPTTPVFFGTIMTVTGLLYIYWNPMVTRAIMRTAALLALGAMAIRSSSNIVGKIGLELIPNPMMAAFVSYSVSCAVALIIGPFRHSTHIVPFLGIAWFGGVGVLTAGAAYCLFAALLHGQVILVAPVMAVHPLFTMVSGWLLGIEQLTAKVLAGALATLAGAVIVSVALHA